MAAGGNRTKSKHPQYDAIPESGESPSHQGFMSSHSEMNGKSQFEDLCLLQHPQKNGDGSSSSFKESNPNHASVRSSDKKKTSSARGSTDKDPPGHLSIDQLSQEVKSFRRLHERWIRMVLLSFATPSALQCSLSADTNARATFDRWERALSRLSLPFPHNAFSDLRLSQRLLQGALRQTSAQIKKSGGPPSINQTRLLIGEAKDPANAGLVGIFQDRLDHLIDWLQKIQSQTDFLTEIPNRRFLHESYPLLRKIDQRLCLIAVDLDRFKALNDGFGHPVGDAVLQEIAKILRDNIRKEEKGFVIRIGGDEFVVLARTGQSGGMRLGERLRSAVESRFRQKRYLDGVWLPPLGITVSVGVALCQKANGLFPSLNDALRGADRALYRAKHAGGNRVNFCIDSRESPKNSPDES